MDIVPVLIVIFLGVFTQSLTGFGSALIAMAFLPGLIGIHFASPLVALVAGTMELLLLLHYRGSVNLVAVWRLSLASVVGIPVGVFVLRQADDRLVLILLGLVIAGYSLYALLNLRLPELRRPAWAYGFGFLAGMLGGAYNTSGPPAVIYGTGSRWLPSEFKSNLQGFFLLNDILVIAGHTLVGNVTLQILRAYLFALPVIGLGILAGTQMVKLLKPEAFRKIVLGLLFLMGIKMIITSI